MNLFFTSLSIISSLFISLSNVNNVKNANLFRYNNNEIKTLIEDNSNLLYSSEEILALSYDSYINEFNDYIKVDSINVNDKSLINLKDYDSSYKVPSFSDVMYNRQFNFESSLNDENRIYYETFKEEDEDFDRYVNLNASKYTNLNPKLSYDHNVSTNKVSSLDELIMLLSSVGLNIEAITAFNASILTLSSAIKSFLIPLIGKTIAIGVATGALIAIVTIIVLYWEEITNIFQEIWDYFLNKFNSFKTIINLLFNDALKKVNTSYNSISAEIDGKEYIFSECKWNEQTRILNLVKKVQLDSEYIMLMTYISKIKFYFCTAFVNLEFCIKNRTHYYGYSSYTLLENVAKKLIISAGTGYTSDTPEIDSSFYDSKNLYYKHYHNCDDKGKRIETKPQVYSHSFFGNAYVIKSEGSTPVLYE